MGGSSSEKNIGVIAGGHAPIDDGFNLQAIEPGFVMEFGEMLSVHTNYNLFWDHYDQWGGEWEDVFIALDLPNGISFRGGQFLVPFGYENSTPSNPGRRGSISRPLKKRFPINL